MSEAKKENPSPDATQAWETMMGMQQKWVETMSGMTSAMMGARPAASMADPMSMLKTWNETLNTAMAQGMAACGSPSADAAGVMERMQQAARTYLSLLGMWAQMPASASPSADPKQAMDAMTAPMRTFMATLFGWPGAPEAQTMPGSAEAWQQATTSMADNWARFATDLFRRASSGMTSPEARIQSVRDFYTSFVKSYEDTAGRFVNMPAVGPARYGVEKLEKSADSFVKFQAASADFNAKLCQTGIETLEEVLAESKEIFSGDITDDTFNRFYHLLLNVGERRFHHLFTSELFCRSLETMVNTSLDFYKARNDLLEETLKTTPIVTQTQADQIHREIYLLKKRIAELERRSDIQD